MNPTNTASILSVALAASALLAPAAHAEKATVERVINGDTVRVRDQSGHTRDVRLSGVAAPYRSENGAYEARRDLSGQMRPGRTVDVTSDGTDRHGTDRARVTIDGKDVGRRVLERGDGVYNAPTGRASLPAQDRSAYRAAADRAERSGAGVWKQKQPDVLDRKRRD